MPKSVCLILFNAKAETKKKIYIFLISLLVENNIPQNLPRIIEDVKDDHPGIKIDTFDDEQLIVKKMISFDMKLFFSIFIMSQF